MDLNDVRAVTSMCLASSMSGLRRWRIGIESTCQCRRCQRYGCDQLGRSLGVGNVNPPQYPCLENPKYRGVWQATVHRDAKSLTQLSNWVHTHTHTHTHQCPGEKHMSLLIICITQRPGVSKEGCPRVIWKWAQRWRVWRWVFALWLSELSGICLNPLQHPCLWFTPSLSPEWVYLFF